MDAPISAISIEPRFFLLCKDCLLFWLLVVLEIRTKYAKEKEKKSEILLKLKIIPEKEKMNSLT